MQGIEKKFWRFALPSMLSQLLNSFFIIVDGFFVGQNLGDAGLAAINVAWPLVALLQASSLAIGTGGAVRLAMAEGRGDRDAALRARGSTLVLLALTTLVLGSALLIFYPVLLPVMGANAELYPLAAQYVQVTFSLSALLVFCTGLLPLIRGTGQATAAMMLMILGLLSNIFLDWLFIQEFSWGLSGASFATALSQGISAVLSLPVLLCQKGWDLRRSDFKIRPRLMVGILHYGISPFGLSISISVMMLITNLRALRYGGTEGVAIYAVLSYVLGSIQPLITGVGDGIQPLLSNARGAGNEVAVTRLRHKGLALAVGSALVCGGCCWLGRNLLPVIFGSSPDTAAHVSGAMWTMALAFPFMAVTRFLCSYFCAVGEPRASSALAYGEPLVVQPILLLLLPLALDLLGVWVSYPLSVMVMAVFALTLLTRQLRRPSSL